MKSSLSIIYGHIPIVLAGQHTAGIIGYNTPGMSNNFICIQNYLGNTGCCGAASLFVINDEQWNDFTFLPALIRENRWNVILLQTNLKESTWLSPFVLMKRSIDAINNEHKGIFKITIDKLDDKNCLIILNPEDEEACYNWMIGK